jgi:tetratricopeptide (TPR) repeat protein
LEETIEYGAAVHLYSQHSLTVVYLGEALLLAGRDREALERATEALELARSRNERGYQAYALRLLGDIRARAEPPDGRAEASYREALRLADDLGMRPLAAHCHLGLGTLHRRTGQREHAREHLATATTLYRELGLTLWLGQAEASLGEVSGTLPG